MFSEHHFDGTPATKGHGQRPDRHGQRRGGHCQAGRNARRPADAARLLEATALAAARRPETPLITMAMGPLGAVTRVVRRGVGVCASFGTAGAASAPGQPDAAALRAALQAQSACGLG